MSDLPAQTEMATGLLEAVPFAMTVAQVRRQQIQLYRFDSS